MVIFTSEKNLLGKEERDWLNVITLSKMICQARKITPNLGNIPGTCVYCGLPTEHGHKFEPTGQFTTYQLILGGSCICPECNEMKNSQDYRRSMWAVTPYEFKPFKQVEAKSILQNPPEPPFVMYFTQTWKKQGWPGLVNRVNTDKEYFIVGYDYELVLVEAKKRDSYLEFAQSLIDKGLNKTELATGELKAKSYDKVDFSEVKRLKELSGDPLWDLVVYVTRKNYDK